MKAKIIAVLQNAGLILMWILIPGLMGGAIYALPAIALTKEREPWLSLILGACLGVSVFGLGLCLDTPLVYLAAAWLLSVLALLVFRVVFGGMNRTEKFALPHALALLLTMVACHLARHTSKKIGQ